MSDTKTDVSNPEVLVREKLDELIRIGQSYPIETDLAVSFISLSAEVKQSILESNE